MYCLMIPTTFHILSNVSVCDGWIIVVVYNAENHRSEIVILDAENLEKGRIAKLGLKHHIPYGLHWSFTPEIFI